MYFDFDDRYRDIEPVGSAINRRDGVALAIGIHAVIVALLLFAPQYIQQFLPEQVVQQPPPQQRPREEQPRFVFVQPRVELPPTRQPDRVEMSDLDRSARSPDKATPKLENPLPMARGNSSERTEATPEEKMRGQGPAQQPAPSAPPVETPSAIDQRQADAALMQKPQMQQPPPGGALGDALRNLQKYVQNESFSNQKGQSQEF